MDFANTAEEEALVEALRELLAQRCTSADLRTWEEQGASFDDSFLANLREAGFLDEDLPSFTTLTLLVEEAGRWLAPPLLSFVCGFVRHLAEGTPIEGDVCAPTLPGRSAVRLAGGALHGWAEAVHFLDRVDTMLVRVEDDHGAMLARLPVDAPGVRSERWEMQSALPQWRVVFEGAVPTGVAPVAAERWSVSSDRLRTCLAARAVGAGRRALELAVAHACERRQFGHPIGSYQSVQNRLVDASAALDEARVLTLRAASLLDEPDPRSDGEGEGEGSTLAALARRHSASACQQATLAAMRTFGGYGFIVESEVQRYFRCGKEMQLRFEAPVRWPPDMRLKPFRAGDGGL